MRIALLVPATKVNARETRSTAQTGPAELNTVIEDAQASGVTAAILTVNAGLEHHFAVLAIASQVTASNHQNLHQALLAGLAATQQMGPVEEITSTLAMWYGAPAATRTVYVALLRTTAASDGEYTESKVNATSHK